MNSQIMTVDVEDYFQVSAFEGLVDRAQWHRFPSRVEANTDRLLALFARRQVSATFFVLAWVAERRPALVRRIVAAGHEVASHGCIHQRVDSMTPQAFRQDAERSRKQLEDLCGCAVRGYRAPSFSIGEAVPWAHDTLLAAGYQYSSSIYPVRHDHYGSPAAPRQAYRTGSGLLEIPLSTLRLLGRNYPISGGGFFRLYPLWLSLWALRCFHQQRQGPYLFYIHPWELDPAQPRLPGSGWRRRLRHYLNLERVEARLERLTAQGQWQSIEQVFFQPELSDDKERVIDARISTG